MLLTERIASLRLQGKSTRASFGCRSDSKWKQQGPSFRSLWNTPSFPQNPTSKFLVRQLGESVTVWESNCGEGAEFTFHYYGVICYVPGFTLRGEEEPFPGKGPHIQVLCLWSTHIRGDFCRELGSDDAVSRDLLWHNRGVVPSFRNYCCNAPVSEQGGISPTKTEL